MTQPLRTEDLPRFDTYPGPESRETSSAGSSLQSAAEQIGGTVGRAVRAARELPERAARLREALRDRMTVIRGGARSSLADRASGLKDATQQRFEEGKQRAAERARQARAQAVRIADQRPLHVLLAIAAAGLIAGAALRLRRNHD